MNYHGITNFTAYRSRTIETFITVSEVFTQSELDSIIDIMAKQKLFKGVVGVGDNEKELETSRKSDISFISVNQDTHWIFKKLNEVIEDINYKHYNFDLNGYDHLQYTEYDSSYGGKYDFHMDAVIGEAMPPKMLEMRKLSFTFLLSEPEVEFKGGEFEILINHLQPIRPVLKKGSIIFFPSFILHRVAQVTDGKRKSLVGWITGPKFR